MAARLVGRIERSAESVIDLGRAVLLFKNWRTYLSLLSSRGDGYATLETRDGIKLKVRENIWDARIVREIFIQRPYLQGGPLPEAPTIIDIGGYIGDFSIYAAKRLGARVIVYEPTAENWHVLEQNIALNGLGGAITAVNRAVGTDGTLSLNVEVDGQEVHSSAYWYSDAPRREVQSVTLDRLLSDHELERVDLLKVDCEGGEYDIFEQASDDALARVDRIALEWHEVGPSTDELVSRMRRRLSSAGFELAESRRILTGARSSVSPS